MVDAIGSSSTDWTRALDNEDDAVGRRAAASRTEVATAPPEVSQGPDVNGALLVKAAQAQAAATPRPLLAMGVDATVAVGMPDQDTAVQRRLDTFFASAAPIYRMPAGDGRAVEVAVATPFRIRGTTEVRPGETDETTLRHAAQNVRPGRLRYSFGGHAYVLALDPPRLERETHGDGSLTWNYGAFHGEACEERECAPVLLEARLADESFARDGWKTTGLGECATLVDGAPARGDDTSHGERVAHDASSSVRLLLSEGTLYVEVTDDVFVTKGRVVDALVFHSSSTHAMPGERGRTERLRMDGTLTDWDGKARQVEVATGPTTRRFALTDAWPGPDDPEGRWRMAYEDTDDGRTFGPGQSTGRLGQEPWVFTSSTACVARDGVLRVERTSVADPDRPIAP